MIVPWKHNKRYGQEASYEKGMAWLNSACAVVEDWGCALCYAKNYRIGPYRGVDGTPGKADVVADLSGYTSSVEGVFMRGILEHNYDWKVILRNAIASFTKRMTLILYRPLQDAEKVVLKKPVELDLSRFELVPMIAPFLSGIEIVQPSAHGHETIFYLERKW